MDKLFTTMPYKDYRQTIGKAQVDQLPLFQQPPKRPRKFFCVSTCEACRADIRAYCDWFRAQMDASESEDADEKVKLAEGFMSELCEG